MVTVKLPKLSATIRKLTIEKLQSSFKESNQVWSKSASLWLKQEIVRIIKSGRSPVEGQGRFVEYSYSYKKLIQKSNKKNSKGNSIFKNKKIRPVNLYLTGKMLDSIQTKFIKNGFRISFRDKKAVYHTILGAGRSRVIRKMLPTGNEEFTRTINSNLTNTYKSILNSKIK